jgi:hypothetical protein
MLRRTAIALLLVGLALSTSAQAGGWGAEFKVCIVDAVLQLLPTGVQSRLPKDAEAIRQAVKEAEALGGRDPAEHFAAVSKLLRDPNADPAHVLAELVTLSMYYIDKTAPSAPDEFFELVDHGNAVSRVRLDGSHQVKNYPAFIALIEKNTAAAMQDISARVACRLDGCDLNVADNVASLYNLLVNVTVDVWTTAALNAGIKLGTGQALGTEVHPRMAMPMEEVYRPSGADVVVLLVELQRQAVAQGIESELTVPTAGGAGDVDELVVEDGVTITGDEVRQSADQLAGSNMRVEADVRQFEGVDEQTLAALRELGIDVNARRQPFHGTRGGVQPGQVIRVGDVDFNVGRLSTVELGSREQRQVLMQFSDEAMGIGATGGHLSQKVVAGVIQANVGAFRSCFERRLRDAPNLAGRVFIKFTIGADGAVSKAEIVQNTTGDAVFADCLIRSMMRLRFPKPQGGEVEFLFPFIFEQTL